MSLRPLAILTIAAVALAGCGKLGDLERPGPLVGAGSGVDAGPDPSRTVRTIDPRNNNYDDRPLPPRTLPVDSAPSATSSAPQGALPDPYQNPR